MAFPWCDSRRWSSLLCFPHALSPSQTLVTGCRQVFVLSIFRPFLRTPWALRCHGRLHRKGNVFHTKMWTKIVKKVGLYFFGLLMNWQFIYCDLTAECHFCHNGRLTWEYFPILPFSCWNFLVFFYFWSLKFSSCFQVLETSTFLFHSNSSVVTSAFSRLGIVRGA